MVDEQFLDDLEDLVTKHIERGTPIETIAYYLGVSHMALLAEGVRKHYEPND